jgi:hypothetical protein
LRRLTWAKPKLLDEAHEEMELTVWRGRDELIQALNSDNPRRRMWGADRILSSWMARDSPHARARATIVTSFPEEPGATVIERDGKSTPVPRYDEGRGDDCVESEAAPPVMSIEQTARPSLPVWPALAYRRRGLRSFDDDYRFVETHSGMAPYKHFDVMGSLGTKRSLAKSWPAIATRRGFRKTL